MKYLRNKSLDYSERFFSNERFYMNSYGSMLADDLKLGIMSFRYVENKKEFSVKVDSNIDSAVDVLQGCFCQGIYWSLEEGISRFIENIVGSMVYNKKTYVEFNLSVEKEGFKLTFKEIRSDSILGVSPVFFQYNKGEKRIPSLFCVFSKNIFCFKMPKYYLYKRIYNKIQLLNIGSGPGFMLKEDFYEKGVKGFDFSAFRLRKSIMLAKLVRKIGWNVRSLLNEYQTEFYYFHKTILFDEYKALIRESVVKQLNDSLNKLFKGSGKYIEVSLKGINNSKFYRDLHEKVSKGEITFMDYINERK